MTAINRRERLHRVRLSCTRRCRPGVDVLRGGAPTDGTRVLLGAFGAGLTWCAGVLEWGVPPAGAVAIPRADPAGIVMRPHRLAG